MLSYEFYKTTHLTVLFVWFLCIAHTLLVPEPRRPFKILSGVMTLLMLVAGMGLLARIGIDHGSGWPVWVYLKILIWLLVAVLTPVVAKRATQNKGTKERLLYFVTLLFALGAYLAINKPGE